MKLKPVVLEEVTHYLETRATPKTATELIEFTQLLQEIKQKGIPIIWEHIQENVFERMFDEFGGRSDPSFATLINAGQKLEPGNLERYQKSIQSSEGYRQYCNHLLLRSAHAFFNSSQPQISADSSEELGHHSALSRNR